MNPPSRCPRTSARSATGCADSAAVVCIMDAPQSVEDQVEPELERLHVVVRALRQVLVAMLQEVRILVERDLAHQLLDELRTVRSGHRVDRLPDREADDVRVEDV